MKKLTYKMVAGAAGVLALTVLTSLPAAGVEYDLVLNETLNGPGGAIFSRVGLQSTGTGTWQPFLDMDNRPIEQAYNIEGSVSLVMDAHRSQWNHLLQVGDLETINKDGIDYYFFVLDSNETGTGNPDRLISVDNIRIYTKSIPVGGDPNQITDNPDTLGTLRYSMNDPWGPPGPYNVENWIKVDSTLGPSAGGGSADLMVYIPISLFAGASDDDYLYFYNLNAVHYTADSSLGADAGYEEWRAYVGASVEPPPSVADGGMTVAMLGVALILMGAASRRLCR